MNEETNWAAQIQVYVAQMGTKDNAIKFEVLKHLHRSIGTCLKQWEKAIIQESQGYKLWVQNGKPSKGLSRKEYKILRSI